MTWITGGDAHKCAKISSLLPFPFNRLSLSIKTKGTEQTTPRDYIFQSSSSLKSQTPAGENKSSCLNGERNISYSHTEIFRISLNAPELACSTSVCSFLLKKEICTSPEIQDQAQPGVSFSFTLSVSPEVRITSRTAPEKTRESGLGLLCYSKQLCCFYK